MAKKPASSTPARASRPGRGPALDAAARALATIGADARHRADANEPHTSAWIRLIDILEAAGADPAIARSSAGREFVDLLLETLKDSIFAPNGEQPILDLLHMLRAEAAAKARSKGGAETAKRLKEAAADRDAALLKEARALRRTNSLLSVRAIAGMLSERGFGGKKAIYAKLLRLLPRG